MAFAIPRIQYKNVDTTGTTANLSGTITGIADTSRIEIGMFVRGAGIPVGALVGSKTSSTVTLAAAVLATASATVPIAFGYEILFDYPPIEPTGEALEAKAVTSESLSGIQQTALNYIEGKRELKFSFLTNTIYQLVDTFLKTHALLGDSFRYFEDKTLSTYVEYELDALKTKPRKIAAKGVDVYVWEVPLSFRRVV